MTTKRTTLVIFDIDGTLLHSAGLHHELITKILAADGLDVLFQPWGSYKNYTDRGVLDELIRHTHGRAVTDADIQRYDDAYEKALFDHLSGSALNEIPGARKLLDDLSAMDGIAMSFATGSLKKMAVVKLDLLGVDGKLAALATGSDYLSREEIVAASIALACADADMELDVVVLGDGAWDERTAVNLGIPFVALETGTYRFGDTPVLKIKDFTGIGAEQLVALARPLRRDLVEAALKERQAA